MPNLTPSTDITSTPKQFHTLQSRSNAPPAIETHKSSNLELTELHLLVWASQELESEGQLPWQYYKDCLLRCSEPTEQLN